ncbi:MAG: hypothetical protein HN644_13695 [Rhodospirillales bacterium]|jgi:hypothetical protein|nr:hypothetical protein [Rhodospirillales bacterium]MBT4039675.1 hypothetical protein [Rhodospirillales bacterium]MBT4626453.1 hypothetical protein [Rhodospirillales bacterium]MBT5350864.1 hypothetical protein [Rhodospirillales bacterium]MBT5520696.1 hypothetical protein [Rhodospirillales bacterium]
MNLTWHIPAFKTQPWAILYLSIFMALGVNQAAAEEVRVSGSTALDLRWFPQPPGFSGQHSGIETSASLSPEFRYQVEGDGPQVVFVPFARFSNRDAERSHVDIREAYVADRLDEWDYLIGINRVFWGVAESRHLVNIINQTDAIEDTDDEAKLGQFMVNVGLQKDWGRVDAFVLPGFRERTFAGTNGRLRTGEVVDDSQAVFESGAGTSHVDLAARYSHYIGDWDVGASFFHGLSREARLPVGAGNRRAPHYDLITQAGLDLQYTMDEWLWKFEGIVREGHDDPFGAMVGGFEYTIFQISESDADLGLLAELHWDGRKEANAPSTVFNNDLFLGSRLALNDVNDTQALIGGLIDVEDGAMSLSLEASTRLDDQWKVELEARVLTNINEDNSLAAFERDSFVNFSLIRYF